MENGGGSGEGKREGDNYLNKNPQNDKKKFSNLLKKKKNVLIKRLRIQTVEYVHANARNISIGRTAGIFSRIRQLGILY